MRYFTKQIWRGLQDERSLGRWARQWDQNSRAYRRQLLRLKGRLGARAFRFFTHHLLHDGRFICLQVREREVSLPQASFTTKVEIEVMAGTSAATLYRLQYLDVSTIRLDVPSNEPLFLTGSGARIRWWGYDELTAAKGGRLRHEILFDSGSTLLIEFKRFAFTFRRQ
jgi:hypothetical protein